MKKHILILLTAILMSGCWFANDAKQTVKDEFAPSVMLEKYEWFKNTSAVLDKKLQDIKVYKENIAIMKEDYADVPRKDWDRTDKQQYNQWSTELSGVKASYNSLVGEYNAQRSKFNWQAFEGEPPKKYRELLLTD